MGPTTRSMGYDYGSILSSSRCSVEQLFDTLDPIQKTFTCSAQYRPYWRYALYHRYVGHYKPDGISSSWINYGVLHTPFETKTEVDCSEIPPGLYQSTLELRKEDVKLLKIHLYYSTGKILIQGKACGAWVDSEFDRLRNIVHTLAVSQTSPTRLLLTDIQNPDSNTASSVLAPAMFPASQDDSALLQPPSATTSHLALPSVVMPNWPGDLIVASSPIPKTRRQAADTTDKSTTKTSSATISETSSTTTKNNTITTDDSYGNSVSSAPVSCVGGETTTKNDNACISNSLHTDCVSMAFHTAAMEELQSQVTALRASVLEMRQHYNTEIDHLQTIVYKLQDTRTPNTRSKEGSIKSNNNKKNREPVLQNKAPKHKLPLSLNSVQSVPDNNYNQQQSSPSLCESENSIPTPSTSVSVSPCVKTPSNEEGWPELPVFSKDIKTIILGDSVFKGLHEEKMSVGKEKTKVLSLSGLTQSKLISLLNGTLPLTQIETAVLHIGANDCKLGYIIGKQAWRSVITAAKRCFPKATLLLSSILPNPHNPCDCVTSSNRNLFEVCHAMQIRVVDNNRSFCQPNGSPIKSFFKDALHPNTRGTSALAISIKRQYSAPYLTRSAITQKQSQSQGRAPPLLPKPSTQPSSPPLSSAHFPPLPTKPLTPAKAPAAIKRYHSSMPASTSAAHPLQPAMQSSSPPITQHQPVFTRPTTPRYPPYHPPHLPPFAAGPYNFYRPPPPKSQTLISEEERSLVFSLLTRLLA